MAEKDFPLSAITDNLGTGFIGQKILYYPRLSSTMTAAKKAVQRGTAEGTVVIAGEQTAGRGRLKRPWLTPRGNIALSIILYPSKAYLPYLVMVSSLAVVHSIEAVTGLITQIKWPNDVLINGKKVGGILVETQFSGEKVAYSIVGIGINVSLHPAEYPELQHPATSLGTELGEAVSRPELLRYLFNEFERLYRSLSLADSIVEEWRGRLAMLGRNVRVGMGDRLLEGIAESIARDGSLMLRLPDGSCSRIVAGDVTLIWP